MKIATLSAFALLGVGFATMPAGAQSSLPEGELIETCYVQRAGVVYRVAAEDAPDDCRGRHVPLAWNAYIDLLSLQRRLSGACPEGSSIVAIAGDGSVSCAADSDRAAGIDLGSFQVRVAGACEDGSSIRSIAADGSVECKQDELGDLSSYQAAITGSCDDGSIREVNQDGTVVCQLDRYTVVTYSGEFDLSRRDTGADAERSLGSDSNRVCFLTRVAFEDLDSRGEKGECRVYRSGGNWRLRADIDNTEDGNAWCSARCLVSSVQP